MEYADDIILITESDVDMEDLWKVNILLSEKSMQIRPKKSLQIANFDCTVLSIPKKIMKIGH